MIDSYLWVFVPAIILLTLTPGIDTLLVIRNTARGGWRDGLTGVILAVSSAYSSFLRYTRAELIRRGEDETEA